MPTLDYPIRVPSDVLEALGEFTGHRWSDSKRRPEIGDEQKKWEEEEIKHPLLTIDKTKTQISCRAEGAISRALSR